MRPIFGKKPDLHPPPSISTRPIPNTPLYISWLPKHRLDDQALSLSSPFLPFFSIFLFIFPAISRFCGFRRKNISKSIFQFTSGSANLKSASMRLGLPHHLEAFCWLALGSSGQGVYGRYSKKNIAGICSFM